ncbi:MULTISPECIES: glutaredoxin family protein [unclassified Virgibacillus]|uniref:glutaredoxin family protein n=1 Tax=unclassified Virgibacillus TaxID=2620237 RepID=UPI0024DE63BC|nr:glutaredoxin family protein [Virgibacillus sp. LDC-1]
MAEREIVVYISNHCSQCDALTDQLDDWGVAYTTKNVTENNHYRKEMQENGIYGTPATFIEGNQKAILGFQKERLQIELGCL